MLTKNKEMKKRKMILLPSFRVTLSLSVLSRRMQLRKGMNSEMVVVRTLLYDQCAAVE
jgi:hypothetical protein